MTTSKTERDVDPLSQHVHITARRNRSPVLGKDTCAVQLGQSLDSPAKIGVGDVTDSRRMTRQRVEDQWTRTAQDIVGTPNRKESACSSAFTSNFAGECQHCVEDLPAAPVCV